MAHLARFWGRVGAEECYSILRHKGSLRTLAAWLQQFGLCTTVFSVNRRRNRPSLHLRAPESRPNLQHSTVQAAGAGAVPGWLVMDDMEFWTSVLEVHTGLPGLGYRWG